MALIDDIVTIYDNYDYTTQVLAASVRGPLHVVEAARLGADICTIPLKVFKQLIKHPLTDIGLANFMKDWDTMASPVQK
jgi:transaldolase